jgi:hypothetical protein
VARSPSGLLTTGALYLSGSPPRHLNVALAPGGRRAARSPPPGPVAANPGLGSRRRGTVQGGAETSGRMSTPTGETGGYLSLAGQGFDDDGHSHGPGS